MDGLTTVFTIVLGILLRVAIPIAATLLLIIVFKWLDERWQREAGSDGVAIVQPGNLGCWETNKCPEEQRAGCQAYANPDKPCWQVFREKDGRLQERCIGCDIFKHAPVPITA